MGGTMSARPGRHSPPGGSLCSHPADRPAYAVEVTHGVTADTEDLLVTYELVGQDGETVNPCEICDYAYQEWAKAVNDSLHSTQPEGWTISPKYGRVFARES